MAIELNHVEVPISPGSLNLKLVFWDLIVVENWEFELNQVWSRFRSFNWTRLYSFETGFCS